MYNQQRSAEHAFNPSGCAGSLNCSSPRSQTSNHDALISIYLGASANTAGTAKELTELYFDVLTSYHAFPPLDRAAVWTNNSIDVSLIPAVLAVNIVSIDVISPSTSEVIVSTRKLLHYNTQPCIQTDAHQHACDNPIGSKRRRCRISTTSISNSF